MSLPRLRARRTTPALLRRAVDALPLPTRIAMLDGVRHDPIIVGAYTDDRSGVCPMLAAHRRGARCSYPAFARTWDVFAGAPRRGHRPADPADVRCLEELLCESIEAELRGPLATAEAAPCPAAVPGASADVPDDPATASRARSRRERVLVGPH